MKTRRILSVVLAVLMIAAMFPVTALADSGNHSEHDHEGWFNGIRVIIKAGKGGSIWSPDNQAGVNLGHKDTWTFRADPDTGYEFVGWTYNGNQVEGAFTSNNRDLSVYFSTKNKTYRAQAVFALLPRYSLGTSVEGSGSVSKNPNQTDYIKGTSVKLTASPQPGWFFSHWEGSASGSDNPLTVTMDQEKNIKAVFEALPTYSLAVNTVGSGSVAKNPNEASYWQGRSVALTANPENGWRFGSWSGDASGSSNPTTIIMDADKSVTATFIKTFKITLNTEGQGHLDNEDAVERDHDIDTEIDLNGAGPEPNFMSTWLFLGWRDDDTGEFLDNPVFTLTRDRKFTAVFTERNRLSLAAGDHGYLDNPGLGVHYAEGTEINLNDARPKGKPGYTLKHWKEHGYMFWGDGTVVPLVDGQPIITIGESNYFKAYFEIANYTITYDLNGGTVSGNPATYTYFDANFTLNNPQREGYTFVGWTGTGLAGPTMNVLIKKNSSGNRTYTANWTPIGYGITYDALGTVAGNPTTYTIEDSFTLINPTRPGYGFTGWTGTGLTGLTTTVNVGPGEMGAREYTSNWEASAYSISYDLDGGSVSPANPTSYTIESGNITLKNPAKKGYAFAGWSGTGIPESTYSASVSIPSGSIGDREYFAHWTPVAYAIKYHNYGTVEGNPTSYTIEDSFGLSNPTRPGYEFIGWTGTGLWGLTTNVSVSAGNTGNRNYYANWRVSGITVTGFDVEYDAAWHRITVAGTQPGDVVSYSLDGIHYSYSNPGIYNVTPSFGTRVFVKVDRFGAAPFFGSAVAKIRKATLTVTADNKSITYGDAAPAYTVTYTGFKGFDNKYVLVGAPKITCSYEQNVSGVGSYVIDVEKGTLWAWNYSFDYADGSLTVGKKALDVKAQDKSITYGDAAPAYTVAYEGFVGSDDASVIAGAPEVGSSYEKDISGAGSYVIDVEPGTLSSANYEMNCIDGTLTVGKAALTVTADNKTVTFLDVPPAYTVSYSGFVAGDTAGDLSGTLALDCDYAAGDAVGTYAITPDGFTSGNYDITFVPGTLTVNTLYLTVTFRDYDGDLLGTDTVAYGTAATAPADPTRTGYRFTGWSSAFDNVTANITVTARYAVRTYTVTFVDFDGTVIDTQRIDWNDGAAEPDAPEREGYTFTGWDVDFDPVTSNLTVTALYTINTYTVTFVDFDGSVLATQTVDWNTGATAPADPEREGYTFTGWDVGFDPVTSNLTVTALYQQLEVIDNETIPGTDDTSSLDDEDVPKTDGTDGFAWWWILVAALGVGLLFFLIFFVWRRRRPEEEQSK